MKNQKTHLFFTDDHKAFNEEIKKKFDDPGRYVIRFVYSYDELLMILSKDKEKRSCKIAVIEANDQAGRPVIDDYANRLRKAGVAGIILICRQDKLEEITKNVKTRIDALIPQNSSLVMRLHNAVKKIISEHNIRLRKKRRDRSLVALLAFIMLSLIMLFLAWRRFPQFF